MAARTLAAARTAPQRARRSRLFSARARAWAAAAWASGSFFWASKRVREKHLGQSLVVRGALGAEDLLGSASHVLRGGGLALGQVEARQTEVRIGRGQAVAGIAQQASGLGVSLSCHSEIAPRREHLAEAVEVVALSRLVADLAVRGQRLLVHLLGRFQVSPGEEHLAEVGQGRGEPRLVAHLAEEGKRLLVPLLRAGESRPRSGAWPRGRSG